MKLIEKNIDFKMILKNICNVNFSRFQENIVERGPVNRSRHNLIKQNKQLARGKRYFCGTAVNVTNKGNLIKSYHFNFDYRMDSVNDIV